MTYAVIMSRELRLPAIIGTRNATYRLHIDQDITISCAEGENGFIYAGVSDITMETVNLTGLLLVWTNIIINPRNPVAVY